MVVFPNAKINLGLNVVARRADGYHNIETVFYPITLCDVLEVLPADALSLQFFGMSVPGACDDNLVVRAFRLLQRDFSLPEVAISLLKKIPMGAGLGGGSSDAAFMLSLLNRQFGLGLSDDALERYAAQLGADCAFFVRNRPVFAEGIGNEFSDIALSLAGWHILVVLKPDVHVATAEAYAHITCQRWAMPLREALQRPVEAWRDCLFNDFEASVFAQHPVLAEIKQQLYDSGAVYAAMSGSGSAIYGLFPPHAMPPANIGDHFGGCRLYNMVLR